ncbi:Negative transcription regulator padR [Mycobacteroides abscessus subsp. abscessus]|nr:Negative transcription regulator padR [Mycobacteroides abscessus subsp. abscessus]
MEEGFTDWCDEMLSALSISHVPARTDESEIDE